MGDAFLFTFDQKEISKIAEQCATQIVHPCWSQHVNISILQCLEDDSVGRPLGTLAF